MSENETEKRLADELAEWSRAGSKVHMNSLPEIMEQGNETLVAIQKEIFVNNLVERLEAASHDERLSTGALYSEAAAALRALLAKHGR